MFRVQPGEAGGRHNEKVPEILPFSNVGLKALTIACHIVPETGGGIYKGTYPEPAVCPPLVFRARVLAVPVVFLVGLAEGLGQIVHNCLRILPDEIFEQLVAPAKADFMAPGFPLRQALS